MANAVEESVVGRDLLLSRSTSQRREELCLLIQFLVSLKTMFDLGSVTLQWTLALHIPGPPIRGLSKPGFLLICQASMLRSFIAHTIHARPASSTLSNPSRTASMKGCSCTQSMLSFRRRQCPYGSCCGRHRPKWMMARIFGLSFLVSLSPL